MNIENQPRRLIINKIVMENFKSYYGRLEIGPFHRKFTAIVGPNGSGKSNLIESLLFVFGKRANWMRLKSLHQLIHNSSSHGDIKKASVAVEFLEVEDQGSESIDIPNTKFTIKRTVQHTGQSHYSINEQHATMEQVTSLLMSKGIDLNNNRFLILQGEVEQISVMKPQSGDPEKPGLIEYLEDIIGSQAYQEKIDQLIVEAEKLETMRRERGEIMMIVEGDLRRLEPAKNKAVEYVKREKQGMQLQSIQIQVGIFKLNTQRDKLYGQIEKYEKTIQDHNIQNKDFQAKNAEATKELRKFQNEKQDLLQQNTEKKKALDKAQARDEEIRDEIRQISQEQVQIEKELKELISKRSSLTDENNEDQIELPKLKKQQDEMKVQLENINKEYQRLNFQHEDNTQKLLRKKKELEDQIQEPLNKIKLLTQKIDYLKKQQAQLGGKGQDNQVQLKTIQDQINKKSQTIQDLKEVIPKMQDVQQKIQDKLNQHEEILKKSQNQMRDLENEAKSIRQQMNSIQNEKQTQKDQERTVASILDAASSGKLNGVIGRVGDLGWIPQKYDVAASNSCAGGLNAILVENEQVAKKCLDFLKQNRIGRCTFFSLNRMKETCTDFRKPPNLPQNCERLFDLVTPQKEEYRSVFWKVFNNTLVCDDIQTASDLKFKKNINFRYVSLSGQIIETTNIMSGGGEPKQGLINTNANRVIHQGNFEQKTNQLRQKEEQIHLQIKQVQSEMNKEQNEHNQTQREMIQIQQLLKDKKKELDLLQDEETDLSQQLQFQQDSLKRQEQLQQQRNQYSLDIEEQQKELHEEEQKCKGERSEIEIIQKEINQQKSEELIKTKSQLDTLNEKYDKLEDKISQIEARIKAFEKRVNDINKKIDQLEKKNEKRGINQKALKEEQIQIEESCLKVLGTLKALEVRKNEIDEIIDKFKKEQSHLMKEIQNFINQRNELTKKIEDNKIEIAKINDEAKNLNRRLDEVRRQYQDTLREYNFLGDLEEIANISLREQSVVSNNDFLNISILDETKLYDNKGQLIEEAPKNRRSGVAGQLQQIENYEVTQDLSPEELDQFVPIEKELQRALAHVQSKLNEARNDANIQDIDTYKGKYDDFKEKKGLLEKVKEDQLQNRTQLEKVKRERYNMFMSGFQMIQSRLRETYQILTNGGDAEIELVDTMDPFNGGVNFSVRPKNKTWKQMDNLSGGEKTLSSLSLIFALHHFRPTPLYFFDEVDAALDYRNVQIIGNFVKEKTKNAQFIVISLRNNMFELADKLVGIYKTFDMTKTLQIQPNLVLQKVNARKENTGEDSENSRHLANQQ